MFMKNNLIRKAERALQEKGNLNREHLLFDWQGGKGVIWTPWEKGDAKASRKHLTPRRLMCHGILVERLGGEYIGSKDAGIGQGELRWIEQSTSFTIGENDTGEGTAHGVHSGMRATMERLGKSIADKQKLKGVPVLLCGLGSVGFPLMQMLHDDGAIVSIYEKKLSEPTDDKLRTFYDEAKNADTVVDDRHLKTLQALRNKIFTAEDEALESIPKSDRGLHFVCPAASRTEWLTDKINGVMRYEILANRSDAGECLILGPANDQLPLDSEKTTMRDAALKRMTEKGIIYIPDPVVSPGGVIAVSHELTAKWKPENVRDDSIKIVEKSGNMLFDRTDDKRSSTPIYQAFEQLALD